MHFGMLIGTPDSHLSLLPVIQDMTPFGRRNLASQVLEEDWLSLTTIIWENVVSLGPDIHVVFLCFCEPLLMTV